ncbi:class I SAM-dependent methyltransferase [Kineosporia rhizophila]|uniref:class I SAM-dependent methyltransferase n=1 Tax=Kineosporia rhizophila TaxID=84633 RepID=UPI001E3AAC03|nr:class I SAM-dependent methyltransferase [Kineosporia rhizophila]MCE0539525.1 class I SAM-dependent methyltransferase [Kineosporia rhizophila]
MRPYTDLVAEAEQADVTGWDFSWLQGRATEERTPWGYAGQLAQRLAHAHSALDLDTGGGEIIAGAPELPAHMTVTEAWAPNLARAAQTLTPRGVNVVHYSTENLPFADATFDLVTSRHPVRPAWAQIARVLRPGGTYFAQHVGPASAFELIEHFLGPLPRETHVRDPRRESDDATNAGLQVVDLRTARCRMEFHDVGAVVWILRRCVWWVPGFTVARYEPHLRALDETMRGGEPFVAHSTRTLIEARRPTRTA